MEDLLQEIDEYLQEEALETVVPSISIEKIGKNPSYSLEEKISSLVYSYIRSFSVPFAEHFEQYVGIHPSNLTSVSLQLKKEIVNKIHDLFEQMTMPTGFFHHSLHSNARLSTDKIRYLVQGENLADYEWVTTKELNILFEHYKKILFLQFEKLMGMPNDHFEEETLKHILSIMSLSYSSLYKDVSMLSDIYLSSLFGLRKKEILQKMAFDWYQGQPNKFLNTFSIKREHFHIFEHSLFLLTKDERKSFQQSFYEMLQKEFYTLKKKSGKRPKTASHIREELILLQQWV